MLAERGSEVRFAHAWYGLGFRYGSGSGDKCTAAVTIHSGCNANRGERGAEDEE